MYVNVNLGSTICDMYNCFIGRRCDVTKDGSFPLPLLVPLEWSVFPLAVPRAYMGPCYLTIINF